MAVWHYWVKLAVLATAVWLGATAAWIMTASAQAPAGGQTFEVQTLQIQTGAGTLTYRIELAITQAQREQGLMYRPHLPERHGMLFDFGETRDVAMWMKNTLIPLDMLFIRADGQIARIEANAAPHSLTIRTSGGPVRAVLELAGGEAARAGIRVGDRLVHPLFSHPPLQGAGQVKPHGG